MSSWRAPGSILEAPGLDFGGFWDPFFEIWGLLARKMQELIWNQNSLQNILQNCGVFVNNWLAAFLETSVGSPIARLATQSQERQKCRKCLKLLKRPTIFKVQTPTVRPRRLILLPLAPAKKGGRRWSPPRGVSMELEPSWPKMAS